MFMASQSQDVRIAVETLSKQSFGFAVARWQKGSALAESELDQVRQLQAQLRQLAEQLRRDQPKFYTSVSDTISESLLDLKYALNAPPATSLRLHQYIESQAKAG
jgi:hypothetical protein